MPDNETLYYNVINGTAGAFRPLPVRRDKKKSDFRGFLLTVFILVTCIASLGICAQLYWDSYLRVQRLAREVKLVHEELKLSRQLYEERINNLQREVKRLATDDCELEDEPESDEADFVSPTEDKFGDYNDPYYDQSPEGVENTTERDRKSAEKRKQESGLDQLKWSRMEPYDEDEDLENSRRRRSPHSTTSSSKTEKRSLVDNKMASECENKDCDELEMVTKLRLAKKQHLEDRRLTADDSTGADELTLLHSQEQENSTREIVEQSTSAPAKVTKSRKSKIKRKPKAEIQEEEEEPQEQPLKVDESVLAAHFGGHTSNYIHGRHKQYLGNGHLYHPGGVFKDWEPSPWVRNLSMDKHFHLTDNGTLTVTKPGLYFVYAQIYYSNPHSLSSFQMFKNSEPLLQCTIEMYNKTGQARNSCFAGGLAYFNAHDQLSLKEVEGERVTIFEKTKSFFGLFRVNQG